MKYQNRPLSVDAIIIKDQQILLVYRGFEPYKGFWALPGGFVELDETVETAVKREVKEETGLNATNLKLGGVYSSPQRHPQQAIAVAFLTEVTGNPQAGDDAKDLKYYPLNALPEKLAFDHRQMIKDYLAKR